MENIHLKLLKQLAASWNNLDTKNMKSYLTEDVEYESQLIFISISGRPKVLEFFNIKFTAIKELMKTKYILTNAVIGYLPSMDMRPCILLSQIVGEVLLQSTVLIEETDFLISRIEVCFIPHPADVKIGYPSYNENN